MDLADVLSASLDSTRAKLETETVRDVRKIRYRTQGQGILLVVSGTKGLPTLSGSVSVVLAYIVTLGNRSPLLHHSQVSQCMPIQVAMLAATLALTLTLGVGIT